MSILTEWVCFNGKVGVTSNGEYYDLSNFKKLHKEYYAGSISYRAVGSKIRYSWKKCNDTKVEKQVEIPLCPF